MADQKLTALTEDTSPSSSDLGYTVKDPAGTPLSRKATWLNIFKGAALGVLTTNGDLLTRAAGATAAITRAALAADSAFSSLYAPLAGPYLKDYATAVRTSGNVTLNSTSYANIDTGIDLSLTAAAGDVIEVGLSGVMGNQAVAGYIDVATIVSASPVNYFSNGTGTPAGSGVSAWAKETTVASFYQQISGTHLYTLQAGDISGGTVTLRLRYKTGAASNLTLFATTTNIFRWWAKNYGPAS